MEPRVDERDVDGPSRGALPKVEGPRSPVERDARRGAVCVEGQVLQHRLYRLRECELLVLLRLQFVEHTYVEIFRTTPDLFIH